MAGLRRLLARSLLLSAHSLSSPHVPSLPPHFTASHIASLSGGPLPAASNKHVRNGIAWQVNGLPLMMKPDLSFMMFHRHITVDSSPPDSSTANEDMNTKGPSSKLSFRHIMSSVATAPVLPMSLGVAGAIPFLALTPPFPHILPLPEMLSSAPLDAQAAYAAVILSFLGGPNWGLAMVGINASPNHKIFNFTTNSVRYIWSVIPSLLGWYALLMPAASKFAILISSFGLVLSVDFLFVAQGLFPLWYLPLRLLLSSIAILCLFASLLELLIVQKPGSSKHESKEV